jgi:hypothetical protein
VTKGVNTSTSITATLATSFMDSWFLVSNYQENLHLLVDPECKPSHPTHVEGVSHMAQVDGHPLQFLSL